MADCLDKSIFFNKFGAGKSITFSCVGQIFMLLATVFGQNIQFGPLEASVEDGLRLGKAKKMRLFFVFRLACTIFVCLKQFSTEYHEQRGNENRCR